MFYDSGARWERIDFLTLAVALALMLTLVLGIVRSYFFSANGP